MVKPYGAVGLVPTIRGAHARADISRNIDHLEDLAHGAWWLSALDVPVRLLVIPEGALQGFTDEALDITNWVKDIRTEAAQLIYENPIYPKNLYLDETPGNHEWYQQRVIDEQVRKLQNSGIWRRSAYRDQRPERYGAA